MSDDAKGFNTPAHIAALETRVGAIEKGLSSVFESINSLASNTDRRFTELLSQVSSSQKTQWGPIFSAAGVVVAIFVALGSALYAPINANVSRLEFDMRGLVSAREYEARLASEIGRRESALAAIRDENFRQNTEIMRLRDTQVTRAEHERVWGEQSRNRDKLESRVLRLEDRALK